MDLSDTETTARICRALSSETRLEILKCLVAKAMTISELAEAFYLPMSSMCLHIKTLKEANLITVVPKPGMRGSQKLCGIKTANVSLDVFAHVNKITRKPPVFVNMPIGHYCNCEISPPCGIASAVSYLYYEDSPYAFIPRIAQMLPCCGLPGAFWNTSFPTTPCFRTKSPRLSFPLRYALRHPAITITGRPISPLS